MALTPSRRPQRRSPLAGLPVVADPLDALLDEQAECWARGESPGVEAFLGRLGELDGEPALALIYQEYCLAESSGRGPDPETYLSRFPDHRGRLSRMFGLHEALGAGLPGAERDLDEPTDLPEAGDEVGPFRLLRELGRGGLARVFLAEQEDLDDRLVVVKVSTQASAEPRLLARARHPHIVEVLRHDQTADGTLHLVAMPFLGGAPLSAVLAGLRRRGVRPRSGRDLLAELDRAGDPAYPPPRLGRPSREVLASSGYPRAVAWIVARLAEALDHAHDRGVAHGDLKPANVLLTADGVPMLLDFNLAVDWGRASPSGESGGTLAYMAPERLRAVSGVKPLGEPRAADRHRADLYALGLVLREMLAGSEPTGPVPGRSRSTRAQAAALADLRGRDPSLVGIAPGLRPILARCLAPEPADRYGRASELADDLDRWRSDLPPRFAGGAGGLTNLGRWARRRRAAFLAALLCVAAGGVAAVAVTGAHRETLREQAVAKLEALWSHNEPGVYRYRTRLDIVQNGGDQIELAGRLLARYDVLGPEDWRDRPDVQHLPRTDREELEAWLMEQTWRFASVLESRGNSPEDWSRALSGLDRVASRVRLTALEVLRRDLRGRLGLPEPPAPPTAPAAPGWMDAYLNGVAAERLRAREALGFYEDALAARPNSYWANYRAAVVACRLGEFDVAADYLGRCLKLRPDNPALRSLRASCLLSAHRPGDALEDCDLALRLDPDYPVAYRTRLFVRKDLGQSVALKWDLDRCDLLVRPFDPVAASRLRRDVDGLLGVDLKDEELGRTARANPEDLALRYDLAARLRDAGQIDEALSQCRDLLTLNPDHLRARYLFAWLLKDRDRADPAAAQAFAALLDHPRLEELNRMDGLTLRTFHLVAEDHILRGEPEEALAVACRGLERSVHFGRLVGESHYAVARALAAGVSSQGAGDRGRILQAVEHLEQAAAIHPGYLTLWFPEDPLFETARRDLLAVLKARTAGVPPANRPDR